MRGFECDLASVHSHVVGNVVLTLKPLVAWGFTPFSIRAFITAIKRRIRLSNQHLRWVISKHFTAA